MHILVHIKIMLAVGGWIEGNNIYVVFYVSKTVICKFMDFMLKKNYHN